jgi:hypothetical protein
LKRELYWLLGTVTLTGLIGVWIFGDKIFDSTPADFQLHDTYYVFPKTFLLTFILISLLTTMYVARGIYYKLNNRIVNGVLTLLLLVVFVGQIMYLWSMTEFEGHIRAVESSEVYSEMQMDLSSSFTVTKRTLWAWTIITGTIMSITGYKSLKPRD